MTDTDYKMLALAEIDKKIAADDMNAIMVAVENAKDLHNEGQDFWEVLYATIEQPIDRSDVFDYMLKAVETKRGPNGLIKLRRP